MKVKKEEYLLQQVTLGNGVAFGKLYEKYWGVAYSQAYRRLHDAEKAKDVAQEFFLNVWSRRETFISNFPAYLRISIRNQVLKAIAKEKHVDSFFMPEVAAPSVQTDSQIRRAEFYSIYKYLVSKLPPKRQEIFKLHHHDDLTTKVIATELGISVKTVQNQLGKAVQQIKDPLWRLCAI